MGAKKKIKKILRKIIEIIDFFFREQNFFCFFNFKFSKLK
jgi:hypothetical protein